MYKLGREITFDGETNYYTVWDETYAYHIGMTQYLKVAEAMLGAYIEYYLEGDSYE